jgi:hypothetical protein
VAIRPTTDAHIWIYATTGTKKYIKSLKKTYEASNGYNVSWKMSTVGDVILSDGITAKAGTAGALALITYVGNDAETSTTYNHGLALALADASTTATWCSQKGATCLTMHYSSSTDAWNDMAGIANTDYLIDHNPSGHNHNANAAGLARNYNDGTHPTGTSAWFLPSAGQWYKMIDACKNVLGTNNNYTDLRDGFSTRGGTNLQSRDYWSSTEREIDLAHDIDFNDGKWYAIDKKLSGKCYVRACLAF